MSQQIPLLGRKKQNLTWFLDHKDITIHLKESSSTSRLCFSFCSTLDCSSILGVSRHCIWMSTTWKHLRPVLLPTNVGIQSRWFPPQKVSHSLRNSLPRDKARLPGLSNFPHSWLQVRRWPARSCCSGGSNWQSRIRSRKWKRFQRSQPCWHFCFLRYILSSYNSQLPKS